MTTTMHEQFEVLLEQDGDHQCEGLGKDKVCVRVVAMAELPTRFGDFHIIAFENNRDGKEHVAITKGDVIGAKNLPVRLHSECLTGDALGSLRCDCRDQQKCSHPWWLRIKVKGVRQRVNLTELFPQDDAELAAAKAKDMARKGQIVDGHFLTPTTTILTCRFVADRYNESRGKRKHYYLDALLQSKGVDQGNSRTAMLRKR